MHSHNTLKGKILLHNYRIPVIDVTIKLGPSNNSICNMLTTELHVCKKQQHPQLIKMSFHLSLNISSTLVDMYMKLHKHVNLIAQYPLMCSFVCKQLILHVNKNNPHNKLQRKILLDYL